jgi:sugar phosphate isomerase/epimerase
MRIGLDLYTIDHRKLPPEEALNFARSHGLEGVQFLDPAVIDPDMDTNRLIDFRRQADALGLYVEVGLTSPNPVRRARALGHPVTAQEHARTLRREVEAVAALGCSFARAYVGDRHDRFRTDVSWSHQIEATLEVLAPLVPFLNEFGVRIALETHADLMVDELLRIVERLGEASAAVTLDTGNLVMRLDDPVRAVERLAPWVVCTHVKDAVLAFTDRGLCWQARPVGAGGLPIPDLLVPLARHNPRLNLSIELHPRTYDLPIFDPAWLSFFPGLRAENLAAVVRLAWQCEQRFQEGSLPRPEVVEAIPWPERDLDWLARSVGYLKPVVDLLRTL